MKGMWYICLGMSICSLSIYSKIIHEITLSSRTERIDALVFTVKQSVENGVLSEMFSIDGIPVLKSDFYRQYQESSGKETVQNALYKDDKELRRLETLQALEKRCAELELKTKLRSLKEFVKKLESIDLSAYYVFSADGIASLDEYKAVKQWIDQSLALEYGSMHADRLREMVQVCETLPARFDTFLQKTVDEAIKRSDDTVLLKELLAMMAK